MQWEADFLPVGDGERSGDAVALRYAENLAGPPESQSVVVIDGGTKESGQKLVEHVRTYYRTDKVDLVVSTHPDADHVSGLTVVLEELKVGMLLMHRPWEHAAEVKDLFKSGKLTVGTLEDRLEKALQGAKDLEDLARRKNVEIMEPFTGIGTKSGSLLVLGPTRDYYQSLLPDFRRTPAAKEEEPSFLGAIAKAAAEAVKWIAETMTLETLKDDGETPAENNSSVILLGTFGEDRILFTGDAGIPALTAAVDFAASQGIDLTKLRVMQVPHHGSRRNVGPTILNRIKAKTAIVSASKEGAPKHPSKKVVNALIRRGATVIATQGEAICTPPCVIPRKGYGPVTPLLFSGQVEEV